MGGIVRERVTYQGVPCKRGHDGLRFKGGHCCSCRRAYERVRDRTRWQRRRVDPFRFRKWSAWRLANIDRERARGRAGAAIRKARSLASGGVYTYHDIISLFAMQEGRCAAFWCRAELKNSYHVDHITALARGGSNDPSNLQLLCPSCNTSKADDSMFDFYLRVVGRRKLVG
jgi:5-methylcytosine-specific restriction endonuclease McrA